MASAIAPLAIRPSIPQGLSPGELYLGDRIGLTKSAIQRNGVRVDRKRGFALTVPYLGGKKTTARSGVSSHPGFKRDVASSRQLSLGLTPTEESPQSKPGAVSQQGSRTIRPAGHPERAR